MNDIKVVDKVKEDFETFKKYRKAEKLLNKIISELKVEEDRFVELYNRPYDQPQQVRLTTAVNVDGEEEVEFPTTLGHKVSNKISTIPDQDRERQLAAIKSELSENTLYMIRELSQYQKVFKKTLSQYGVKSLAGLPEKKRKEFFNKMDKIWKGRNESALLEVTQYQIFFKQMLNKYGVKSPAEIPKDKRKAFFNSVDKAWKSKHEKKK